LSLRKLPLGLPDWIFCPAIPLDEAMRRLFAEKVSLFDHWPSKHAVSLADISYWSSRVMAINHFRP
jgi:hypothetical protein